MEMESSRQRSEKSTGYLQSPEIKVVHVELTSRCNLLCPQCARTLEGRVNPHIEKRDLSWSDLSRVLTSDVCKGLQHVYFCGNYGDPLASEDCLDVFGQLRARGVPKLTVFTNGSLRGPADFQSLARILSRPSDQVVFAIDGLADTNGIYRVGARWEKLVENARAFIAAGGRARWDFLVFRHNAHQIEEAQRLAKNMGFKAFKVKYTTRFLTGSQLESGKGTNSTMVHKGQKQYEISLPEREELQSASVNRFPRLVSQYGSFVRYAEQTEIRCKSQLENSIYIDFMGRIWPCCWLGSAPYGPTASLQKTQLTEVIQKHGLFNSLYHHSLEDILQHAFFQKELVESWQTPSSSRPRFFTCGRTCGKSYEFSSGAAKENNQLIEF